MTAKLSIIIVNWNGGDLLRRCITSIMQAPPSVAYDIIVVDNASTDDSVSWLRSNETKAFLGNIRLHVIENSNNVGFSKANNQAIAHGQTPLLLLLNPDTEVMPGAIDTLIATLESDARAGACGPRLINPDGSLQVSVWQNPLTAWAILISGLGLYRLIPKRVRGELLLGGYWDHARRRAVPMLCGASILTKREIIDTVGDFDERFHMYSEDVEWSFRVRQAGWQLIFEPAATVMHHGGQSSQQRWTSRERMRVVHEAHFRFQRDHLSRRRLFANLLANCFVLSLQQPWRRLRGIPADDVEPALEVYRDHLKQALRGKVYERREAAD